MNESKIEIPVMFCFDNNYVIPAAITFYSMLENSDKNYIYKLFVLHTDITIENQNKLQDTIKEYSDFSTLEFVNLNNRFEDIWKTIKTKGHFSKEVMYKVLVATIFPQYDKIIVSDVDVVFLGDISESYFSFDTDEDIYLAGVKMIGKMLWYMDVYKKHFNDEEIEKLSGFCGGYIVFNLKKLRSDNMEEKFIKCFKDEGFRINQMEQDILNLCCYPKTKHLPLKYLACSYMWDIYTNDEEINSDSVYSREEIIEALNHPVQLHYATSIKPWKNVDSVKSEEWFKYLTKTPFLKEYLKKLPSTIVLPKKETVHDNNNYTLLHRIKDYVRKHPLFFIDIRFYIKLVVKVTRKIYRIFKSIISRIFRNIKSLVEKKSLIIIDDIFPSALSPFRYEEYLSYLNKFDNVLVLATGKTLPALKEYRSISDVISEFYSKYPEHKNKIIEYKINDSYVDERIKEYINKNKNTVAIMTFVQNVIGDNFNNLEFLEKNNIPFVFTLYPGGGFVINNKECDDKLKKIFSSPFFRKVIVTQKLTYDYLISNNMCPEEKIEFIYGIVTPKELLATTKEKKIYYGYQKNRLDICFVAHKYSPKGIDKGYDLFVESAKILSNKYSNVYFHVVGGFTEEDIDVSSLKDRIYFYGIKDSKWFIEFYKNKDIILSPNRPFILNKGSFDGFPTGSCTDAMLNNVALFCTDELGLNCKFRDRKDVIIIKPDVENIVNSIEYYYKKPEELKTISNNGRKIIIKNYSYKKQIMPRIKILKKIISKK